MSYGKAVWIGGLAAPTAAVALVVASIGAMASRPALPESLQSVLWIQGSLIHVYLLLISVVLAVLLGDKRLKSFGLRSSPIEFLMKASIAGFSLGGLSDALFVVFRVREPELFRGFSIPQQIIFVWLLASLAEEALTRGLMQGMMSVWAERSASLFFVRLQWPVIVSAAFFAFMHLPLLALGADCAAVAIIITSAFVLGLIAGQVRYLSGSLWPAVVMHSSANAAGTLLGILLRR
jgi:membrane protease YdiL (CAAX protease family)